MTAPAEHLDETTWELLATGALGEAARERALAHLVGCRRCTAVYRSVQALEASARAEGLLPRPAAPPRRWLPAGLAALAACAAMVALWPRPAERLDQPSTLRGAELAPVTLQPNDPSPAGRPALAWAPVAGAARYRVSVFTEDGLLAWSLEVAATAATWPDDAAPARGQLRWRVEALRGEDVLARSPLTPLRVAP